MKLNDFELLKTIDIAKSIVKKNKTITVDFKSSKRIRVSGKKSDNKYIIFLLWNQFVEIGKAIKYGNGNDVLLITTGITLGIAQKVSKKLKINNIDSTILHVHTIKPFDKEKIIKVAEKIGVIITIEEHAIIGGLGSACAEVILEAGFQTVKKFKRIGIQDNFPSGYGSQNSMMNRQNITSDNLIRVINSLID